MRIVDDTIGTENEYDDDCAGDGTSSATVRWHTTRTEFLAVRNTPSPSNGFESLCNNSLGTLFSAELLFFAVT